MLAASELQFCGFGFFGGDGFCSPGVPEGATHFEEVRFLLVWCMQWLPVLASALRAVDSLALLIKSDK